MTSIAPDPTYMAANDIRRPSQLVTLANRKRPTVLPSPSRTISITPKPSPSPMSRA